ncbi:MAG: hypothetical protein WC289_02875 [Patescibacteria group bacterium]|jgi:hypothetical protein
MLLLVHTVAGAVIGTSVANPMAGFAIGFVGHLLLDWIPHWNYDIPRKMSIGEFIRFWPDWATSPLIYLSFIALNPSEWISITSAVIGMLLPDLLTLTRYSQTLGKLFGRFRTFHEAIQREVRFTMGIAIQAAFIFIILGVYIYLY